MWRSIREEALNLKGSMDRARDNPESQEFTYKIAVGQAYSWGPTRDDRYYLDLVHVTPERYDVQTGEPAPIKPTGWFPWCPDIANFNLDRRRKWGIDYYTIRHGRTGNDTIGQKPVAIAFSEEGIRADLEQLLEQTVQHVHRVSGYPVRDPREPKLVAYGYRLLRPREQD